MRILAILLSTASILVWASKNANAEEQNLKYCFSIIPTAPVNFGVGVYNNLLGSILLNKCTGQTWMLANSSVGKGETRKWFPINSMNDELIFGATQTAR
jgi:hypothetical protein